MHAPRCGRPPAPLGDRRPEREAVELVARHLVGERSQRRPEVGHREPRPPAEILHRRRAVAVEVAADELHDRLVPVEPAAARRDPLVEQRVRLLLPPPPAAADQPPELGVHQQVRHALTAGIELPPVEDLGELVAGEPIPALEGRRDHLLATREGARVEAELPEPARVALQHARAAQREQPADVVRGDEVPGGPEHVGPHDRAVRDRPVDVGVVQEALRPLPDRPHRRAVLLGLHREVPPHGLVRRREPCARET